MITISVIGVYIFILFVICSQWILVYEPLNFFNNIWGQTYIIVYHLLALLLLRCYSMSVLTDPGSPPSTWLPEGKTKQDLTILIDQFKHLNQSNNKSKSTTVLVDDDLSTITIVNSKNSKNNNNNNNKARFCSQCCAFKPPRTHHCKQCKRCILKHDHHCPWIGNCTGFRNQKFFIQFLFYVVILTSITITTLTISGFYILNVNLNLNDSNSAKINNNNNNNSNEVDFLVSSIIVTIMYIFNFSGVLPVLLGVSGLFFFQMEFLLGNYTPVERYERKKEGKYARRNGLKYKWKFDKGWKFNFREVMGDTLIQWFFPIGFPKTDGTYWRENELYLQQQRLLNNSSSPSSSSSSIIATTNNQPININNNNDDNNNNNIINKNDNGNIKLETIQQQPINGANIGYDDDDDDDDDSESIEINDFIRSDSNQPLIPSNQQSQKPSFGFVENV